jgi:hypothetical protein
MKQMLKKMMIRQVMKKRQKQMNFDEKASELMTLPADADHNYNNSYYYAAHDKSGNAFFFRLGQRGGDNPTAEIWFGFLGADGQAYMNSQQLYELALSPCQTTCLEPLKKWEFSFKGLVVPVKAGTNLIAEPCGEELMAEFSGIFISNQSLFEFGRDTNVKAYAETIAAEKWVKGFSDELKNNTQTRVEQTGWVECSFKVNNQEYTMSTAALRDQAYGRRVWSYMNHYSWLVGNLADGTAFNAVTVYYPAINTIGLSTGYHLVDQKYVPLRRVSFPLEYKTKGLAPTKGSASAQFVNKSKALIEFETKIIFPYQFFDEHGGYNVYEGITKYRFNGIEGWGIAEFSYNQDRSRLTNEKI